MNKLPIYLLADLEALIHDAQALLEQAAAVGLSPEVDARLQSAATALSDLQTHLLAARGEPECLTLSTSQ